MYRIVGKRIVAPLLLFPAEVYCSSRWPVAIIIRTMATGHQLHQVDLFPTEVTLLQQMTWCHHHDDNVNKAWAASSWPVWYWQFLWCLVVSLCSLAGGQLEAHGPEYSPVVHPARNASDLRITYFIYSSLCLGMSYDCTIPLFVFRMTL